METYTKRSKSKETIIYTYILLIIQVGHKNFTLSTLSDVTKVDGWLD